MTSNTLKCTGCNLVVSEVLSYIQYKHDVMDNVSLSTVCETVFTEEEIEVAKALLFESVPTATQRKIVRRKDGKTKRNIEDIICFFKEVDPDCIPIFVARDLQKLPPISIDHIDAVSMMKDIVKLRNDIGIIKENYATISQFQELQDDLENLKLTSVVNFHQNINTKPRGQFFFDSGPIGLSPLKVNDDCEGSKTKSADARGMGECDYEQVLSPSRTSSATASPVPLALVHCSEQAKDSTALQVGGTSRPARPIERADRGSVEQCIANSVPQRVSMADMVRTESEWKSNNPSSEWILVQRKKLRNRFMERTGKAVINSDTKFKAAENRIPLFISNVNKDASEMDICEYVQSKTNEKVTMEKIRMKTDRPYNAFKMYVSKHKLDLYLDDNLWPDGIRFRRFVHFRKRVSTVENNQSTGSNKLNTADGSGIK